MEINYNLIFAAISAASTAIAVWIAWQAMSTWKKQKRSKIAEEIIMMAYELKAIIGTVRNPFSYSSEGLSRKVEQGESSNDKDWLNSLFVPIERLNEHKDKLSEARIIQLKTQLYFPNIGGEFDNLRKIIVEIEVAAVMRYRMREKMSSEESEKQENIIWNMGDKDILNPRIEKCISNIEKELKKYL